LVYSTGKAVNIIKMLYWFYWLFCKPKRTRSL